MAAIAFIGDELSAAGFRLAGVSTQSPEPAQAMHALEHIGEECELLLITAEYARTLPASELQAALSALRPLCLIVPDVRRRVPAPDVAGEVDRSLGIES